MKKKISVIITSYNNSHNLERCLETLFLQNYDRKFYQKEIIVVDSGSTDSSLEILSKFKNKIKIILNQNRFPPYSPAKARNIGVKEARGEILIFSDSDCFFPSDWIRKILFNFEKYNPDCFFGKREPDLGDGIGTFFRRYNFILYSRKFETSRLIFLNRKSIEEEKNLILLAANNFAIKKEIWQKIGGMEESFPPAVGEDIFLEFKLIKNGYTILFDPSIKIFHFHHLSFIELMKKTFYQGIATYLITKEFKNFFNIKYYLQMKNYFKNIFFFLFLYSCFLQKNTFSYYSNFFNLNSRCIKN